MVRKKEISCLLYTSLPEEKSTLVVGMYGSDADFFTIKGMAEQLLEKLCVTDYDIVASSEDYSYHPGRCAVLSIDCLLYTSRCVSETGNPFSQYCLHRPYL